MSIQTFVCTCPHEPLDNPNAINPIERTVVRHTVDAGCPVHGDAGRNVEFHEITSLADNGRRRYCKAFTLIELMIVIVIIGVLVALLLPVVTGAVRTAKHARVAAEFDVLSVKLEAFKVKYGEYPPSRIMLSEDGAWNFADDTMIPVAGGAGEDITYGQLSQRTVSYIRRFWPQVPISTTAAPLFDGSGTWYDFDGDGTFDKPTTPGRGVILDGTEALVFWLGGIPLDTGTSGDPELSLSGFARGKFNFPGLGLRPHPFRNQLENANLAYHGDRDPSFHEFAPSRLADSDGDGFPEFLDSLGTGKPIAWFRSEGNVGYDPNDCNLPEPDTTGTVQAVTRTFRVGFVTASGGRLAISPGPNPMTTSAANTGVTTAWHKPGSFQFLSAGADGLFGVGGRYREDGKTFADKMPLEPTTGTVQNLNSTDAGLRDVERDNVASFVSGTLD
jgi:prepilin-type N-terminal cleavage/methylation domain-containing protein